MLGSHRGGPGSIPGQDMSVLGPLVKDGDDTGHVSSYYITKKALTTAGLLPDCSRAVEWAGGQHLEISVH
jgi:hypothetical protein